MTDRLAQLDRDAEEAADRAAALQQQRLEERQRIDDERTARDREFRTQRLASYDRGAARKAARDAQAAFIAALEDDPTFDALINWRVEQLWSRYLASRANDDAEITGAPQPFPDGIGNRNPEFQLTTAFPAGDGVSVSASDDGPAIPMLASVGPVQAALETIADMRFQVRVDDAEAEYAAYVDAAGATRTPIEQVAFEAAEREAARLAAAKSLSPAPIPAEGLTEAERAQLQLPPGGTRSQADREFTVEFS